MNKSEFVNKMQTYTGETDNQWSKTDCAFAIDCFTKAVEDAVAEGNKVQFVGFGSFEPITTQSRDGVNPQTGEKITITARTKPKFKAGKDFKERVAK